MKHKVITLTLGIKAISRRTKPCRDWERLVAEMERFLGGPFVMEDAAGNPFSSDSIKHTYPSGSVRRDAEGSTPDQYFAPVTLKKKGASYRKHDPETIRLAESAIGLSRKEIVEKFGEKKAEAIIRLTRFRTPSASPGKKRGPKQAPIFFWSDKKVEPSEKAATNVTPIR